MELERETLVEIAVSVGAVGFFVAAIVFVAISFGPEGLVGEEGGTAFVGVMALFILVMTAVGYWLSGRES